MVRLNFFLSVISILILVSVACMKNPSQDASLDGPATDLDRVRNVSAAWELGARPPDLFRWKPTDRALSSGPSIRKSYAISPLPAGH